MKRNFGVNFYNIKIVKYFIKGVICDCITSIESLFLNIMR